MEVEGTAARLRDGRRVLGLTIEVPADAHWEVEHLEEESKANRKPGILKRIRCTLPLGREVVARLRLEVE